jgi:hypothetical protein
MARAKVSTIHHQLEVCSRTICDSTPSIPPRTEIKGSEEDCSIARANIPSQLYFEICSLPVELGHGP